MTVEIVQGGPERVWVAPNHGYENIWARPLFTDPFDEEGTEYVRVDLTSPPPFAVITDAEDARDAYKAMWKQAEADLAALRAVPSDKTPLVDAANALIECLEEGASPRLAMAQLRELIASAQAEEVKGR